MKKPNVSMSFSGVECEVFLESPRVLPIRLKDSKAREMKEALAKGALEGELVRFNNSLMAKAYDVVEFYDEAGELICSAGTGP